MTICLKIGGPATAICLAVRSSAAVRMAFSAEQQEAPDNLQCICAISGPILPHFG